ncbi:MAG: hypothetical protein WDN46_14245 [Methylocella sp.]
MKIEFRSGYKARKFIESVVTVLVSEDDDGNIERDRPISLLISSGPYEASSDTELDLKLSEAICLRDALSLLIEQVK